MKMWKRSCEREAEVREMVRRGLEDPSLLDHAAGCEICRETRLVGTWMRQLAAVPVEPAEAVPVDPAHLWWKAELLRRWDAERQAAAPFDRGEPAQAAVGLVGVGLLSVWLWREAPNVILLLSRLAAWSGSEAGRAMAMVTVLSLVFVAVMVFLTTRDREARE